MEIKFRKMFVFGAIIAFLTLGFVTDLVLQGMYLYCAMVFFILLEIALCLAILFKDNCTSLQNYSYLLQGFLLSSIQVLQLLVLPLSIAAKQRD